MIEELKLKARNISFDSTSVNQATIDDLNLKKITTFLAERKSSKNNKSSYSSITEAMLANKIIARDTQNIPTVTGILLFGKNPQLFFPQAKITCEQFIGVGIHHKIIASKECLGTLDKQFEEAYDFVVNRFYTLKKIVGLRQSEHLEIPQTAVREIIVNAIIHRNYTMQGQIKIAIFNNRLEILSPGVFPFPIIQDLQSGFSYLRNSMIAKIFREMGLIETFGLGFINTFESYKEYGLKPPQIIEGQGFIKCILPRRTPENLLSKTKANQFSEDLMQILNLFTFATEVSVSDVIKILHFSRPTASRKLSELTKKGVLKKIGQGRSVRYVKKNE